MSVTCAGKAWAALKKASTLAASQLDRGPRSPPQARPSPGSVMRLSPYEASDALDQRPEASLRGHERVHAPGVAIGTVSTRW
jgi:hypothetical protein